MINLTNEPKIKKTLYSEQPENQTGPKVMFSENVGFHTAKNSDYRIEKIGLEKLSGI